MKKLFPLGPLVLLLLAGCSNHYTITLSNGTQLGTQGRPVLKGGSYYFKDASGEQKAIAAGRVSQIEPASSSSRGKKSGFLNGP